MADPVLLDREGAVAVVTLNRPEVLNALSIEMAELLCDVCWRIEADPGVRAVLVRGAGKGFQAGGDIASFKREIDRIGEHAGRMIDTYHVAVRTLVRMPKPVVGQLHGAVAGAGMSLAMNLDLAVAAEGTVFTLAYANLGTSPDGGSTFFLPRLVGRRRAMEIALLSDRFDAARAYELGLVNRVVPADKLAEEAMGMAERLAAGPTMAYARTKALIDQSFETDLASQLEAERLNFVASTATADFKEGVAAFTEKRRPNFKGD
ncbi:MAG: enoyl-CoA hydratase [Alphaproteobacteria bacterium]